MADSVQERFAKLSTNLVLHNIRLYKFEASFNDEKINVSMEESKVYIDKNVYYQVVADNHVRVFQEFFFKVALQNNPDEVLIKINPSYILDFQVGGPMDDEIFKIFADSTVLVDSWPYFREIVQSTLLRMGLAPVVLPPINFNPFVNVDASAQSK
jgi:preprotein translocase subunit SecB